jgi:ankyrin repeat protein
VADSEELTELMVTVANGDLARVRTALDADPQLASARLPRRDEFFLAECLAQVYADATPLHVAALAYDVDIARELVSRGADVRAADRRGAEPLHAAVNGVPGSPSWSPARQRAVVEFLIAAGADPNARAKGAVTPLHRAVRNLCSAAVAALLHGGADPHAMTARGSAPIDLARRTTGRGGTGSGPAKAEQQVIVDLLLQATDRLTAR